MKRKDVRIYYYRGGTERGNGKPGYDWHNGYSASGPNGHGVMYPWLTYRECQQDAKADGKVAVFVHMQVSPGDIEIVNGCPVLCFDTGNDKTFDRYTVVYLDAPTDEHGTYQYIGMSANPCHPQGFGQHGEACIADFHGRVIKFGALPESCQALMRRLTKQLAEAVQRAGM